MILASKPLGFTVWRAN